MSSPPVNITVVPDEANLQIWKARITGPVGLYRSLFVNNARELLGINAGVHLQPGTPYAKGTFTVSVEFTKEYPFKPPVVSRIPSCSSHFATCPPSHPSQADRILVDQV